MSDVRLIAGQRASDTRLMIDGRDLVRDLACTSLQLDISAGQVPRLTLELAGPNIHADLPRDAVLRAIDESLEKLRSLRVIVANAPPPADDQTAEDSAPC